MSDCKDCPLPPFLGEPQPTTRCSACPYHGWVKVVETKDGKRVTRYGTPNEEAGVVEHWLF